MSEGWAGTCRQSVAQAHTYRTPVDSSHDRHAEEVSLLSLATVLLRRWRVVAWTTVGVVLLGLVAALLRPDRYTANVVMVPPASQGAATSAVALQLAGLPGMGRLGGAGPRLVSVIAQSRSLADSLVARLSGTSGSSGERAAAIRKLLLRTVVTERPDGSIVVKVTGRDPRLAAEVANAMPPLINSFSVRIGEEAAEHRQEFLEGQLRRARERLDASERRLVAFQRGRNAPEIQEQSRQTIDAASRLQGQITEQELRVSQLRRSATADNPALRSAIGDLDLLRGQLRRMTAGGGGQLFIPFQESAGLKAEVARLTRAYAQDEKMYVALAASLSEAQVDVQNDLPVLSVLDRALVPTAPSGVGLPMILAVAAVLGVLLGIIAAFVVDFLARADRVPEGRGFLAAWAQLKADLPFSRHRNAGRMARTDGGAR